MSIDLEPTAPDTVRLTVLEMVVPRQLLTFLTAHGMTDDEAVAWVKGWNWITLHRQHVVAYPDGPRIRDHRPAGLPVYDGPHPTMVRS